MNIEILTLPPTSSLIPALVGPLTLHPDSKAEMYTASTKTWWVAMVDGQPVGLVAADQRANYVHLQHAFVVPEYRRKGVYEVMFKARNRALAGATLRSVVTPELVETFTRAGFVAVRTKGKYTVMERLGDDA